jgi:putative transposase
MHLVVGRHRAKRQADSRTVNLQKKKEVCGRGLSKVWPSHGKHPVSTDGGTWYRQACRILKRQHHIHSPYEKRIIERTIQRIKDRAECFDDYFPCSRKKGCNFLHIRNWLGLFATMHSKEILNA